MSKAETGNSVAVHYTGKLEDGTVFDSSENREPLSFKLGEGQMIKGFENAVMGMAIGDKTTVSLEPKEAYGERSEERILQVPKSDVPNDIPTEIGTQLSINQSNGQQIPAVITDADAESITLDANHPLAGKKLIFDIEMVEIK
ncbi:peptidylprolyl isomerase [Hyphobacterium sp. CCMP332]|nr:peptidylprolyl isomerase [Hyphobacterium sp. CCMP332]